MAEPTPSRRDLNRLIVAALGGLAAGALPGCSGPPRDKPTDDDPVRLLQDAHVCRGLNTCKGKGKSGSNDCAGKGDCATAKAHTCTGSNDCKGQGGCEDHAGQNSCKGKGSCEVPLRKATWAKARKNFEEQMVKAGKTFDPAPEK